MLNQLINVFWTATSFAVVIYYWERYISEKGIHWPLYVIISLSVLVYLFPGRWFSAFTLSNKRRTYERLGVRFILWFVQNGTFVARVRRNRTEALISNRKSASTYLTTIAMQERYHYCCFVFFLLSTGSAFLIGKITLALLILLSNLVYNVCPILLQQYNRLRINLLLSGSGLSIPLKK
ncbi:hypothetical protein [Dyadobacter sp. NIV53]|uniref:glycosyl-4,4'-diaponeurosporenoate acyltransferase CrtO family protein n=1 Tax=Dyadobacter sp. NIV53 TaxID=2861765 RepID=UPI001C88A5FE|nr:hypothetical protein [Dyadobacter sp. NIV53]